MFDVAVFDRASALEDEYEELRARLGECASADVDLSGIAEFPTRVDATPLEPAE